MTIGGNRREAILFHKVSPIHYSLCFDTVYESALNALTMMDVISLNCSGRAHQSWQAIQVENPTRQLKAVF